MILQLSMSPDRPGGPGAGARGPAERAEESVAAGTPRWWLVRARYSDGWHAIIADATQRSVRVVADGAGQLPDFVVVSAVGRAGVESEGVEVVGPGVGRQGRPTFGGSPSRFPNAARYPSAVAPMSMKKWLTNRNTGL